MDEPKNILPVGTRVITHRELEGTVGMLISDVHLNARKADTPGAIGGIVGGHGGDVYWVAHLDSPMAAYCFSEFELQPITVPCPVCDGSGFDWAASNANKIKRGIGCSACTGTGEKQAERPTAWERLEKNEL